MILIISILISFLATLLIMPSWIKKAKKIGLIWEDMNKHKHPRNVVGSGGIVVLLGFVLGVLSYIAIKTFILETDITTVQIFALLTTVIIAGIIGLIDDFLGWAHGGLSAKFRIFLVFIAAVPLIVINAGESQISIPFLGLVNLGLIYPLIIIPLGIVGATTTYNFLAGYNSLEASQGVILLTSLALVTWLIGDTWISLILLMMVASLLAFLIFNKYPAKIFPGDALTYSVGALIAVVAILSNIERIVVFFFIPYIIETGLKLRGKLAKQSFGKVNKDNSLEVPYEKFYGLEHIAIYLIKRTKKNRKAYEREVVIAINLFQIFIITLGLLIFKGAIF